MTAPDRRRGLGWVAPAVVMALTWLVFRPVLGHGFVEWDDTKLLVETDAYRDLWWPAIRHAFSNTLVGHYAPLTWVSFSVDTWLWGPTAGGFHRTNLLLHVLNAGLFYVVGRTLIQRASTLTGAALGGGAASAALFFAIHPMRAETVAWLTERRGVLSGLFALLSVLAYLRASRGGAGRHWALAASAAAFLLALLAKESVLILPAGLVVLDVYPLRRLAPPGRGWLAPAAWPIWREKLPHIGLACVWAVVAYRSQVAGAQVIRLDPETWVGLVLQSLWYHVQKTILPIRLSPLHEFSGELEFRDPVVLVSGVGVLAVTLAVLGLRRRWPAGLAAWTWQAIALAPFMGVAHAGPQITADRYSYLASWGWALALGGGVGLALRAARRSRPAAALLTVGSAMALAALTLLTVQQARIWEGRGSLWLHAVAVAPGCATCRYNLGTWLLDRGQSALALEHFGTLQARYPSVSRFQGATGVALAGVGRYQEAEGHLRRAVAGLSGSDEAMMRLNLAGALIAQDRLAEGLGEVRRAVGAGPPAAALAHLERGVASTPRKPVLRLALAEAYGALGREAQAAAERAALTELHPELARLAWPHPPASPPGRS